MKFVKVAVARPIRKTFTYKNLVPNENIVGKRVFIEFHRKKIVGVVVQMCSNVDKEFEIKQIISVLDETPLFESNFLKKIKDISQKFFFPMGELLSLFTPNLMRKPKHSDELQKYKIDDTKFEITNNFFKKLTDEQKLAVKNIQNSKKQEHLIFGVTSSGKTEVYKHLIYDEFKKNNSAIILVPEIFLAPKIYEEFKESFGENVFLYHSNLTELQRYKIWLNCQKKSPKIIVGTRSALFLMPKNTNIIVFDEEHDQSFKQQDKLRYDAKSLAKELYQNSKIIYSSATPSFKLLRKVKDREIDVSKLFKRIGEIPTPDISIESINKTKLVGGISETLINKINLNHKAGNQTLILINRRGYAPVYLCNSCGWIAKSNCCESSLVYHREEKRLKCHRCQSSWGLPENCPECNKNDFEVKGVGTQQVESSLKHIFPNIDILRIDSDSVSGKLRRESTLEKIEDKNPKILIGTQLLAKGHDFQKISLIIILNLDFGLFGADVHLQEQTIQLLIQAAGRAGRSGIKSEVILQSRISHHPLFKKVKSGSYELISQDILSEREKLNLFPFTKLIYLKAEDSNLKKINEFLIRAKEKLSKNNVEVYGPFEGPVSKVGYKYRMFCIIQSNNDKDLHNSASGLINALDEEKRTISNWVLDVDPINVT